MAKASPKRSRRRPAALPAPGVPAHRAPEPIDQVFCWIVDGLSEPEILTAIDRDFPGAKPQPLVVAAMKRVAAAAVVDRDSLVGWCIEATRLVYQRALTAGDYGPALRAIRQLHELAGAAADEPDAGPAD